ncbi:MAG: IS21 family transposase [Candidatus Tenebribacter davisii]|nr:IS21 family transposase [Candidatus Tenebribacter davisii]
MIGVKMYHSVKMLESQGMSQREIAKTLSKSKTTVNKYLNLNSEKAEKILLSKSRFSEFEIAYDFIMEKLDKYPQIRSSKLYRLMKNNYPEITSKHRAFRNYVRKLRSEITPTRKRYYQPIINDKPGNQIQVDPGEFVVNRHTKSNYKVYFVVFVSSYSRKKYVHFQTRPYNTIDFIKAHLEAFQYYGALAKEYIYDQTKLVVIKEDYREVWFNEKFHKFALQYGFEPRVCEGYDPESKGKVERVVREVKEDFLYGEFYKDIEDIRSRSLLWFDRINNERHSTTGIEPDVLFTEELITMKPWYISSVENRKSDKVGLISYKGNKYSVPLEYQSRGVFIRPEENNLIIMNKDKEIIAQHRISDSKNQIVRNNNHYRDFSKVLDKLEIECKTVLCRYHNSTAFIERLISENPKIARDQLRGLLKIYKNNNDMDWDFIITKSMELIQLRASRIESIIKETKKKQLLQEIELSAATCYSGKIVTSSIQRSEDFYMKVCYDK